MDIVIIRPGLSRTGSLYHLSVCWSSYSTVHRVSVWGNLWFPGCGCGGCHLVKLWCWFAGFWVYSPEHVTPSSVYNLCLPGWSRLGSTCTGQGLGGCQSQVLVSVGACTREASSKSLSYHRLCLQKLLSVPPHHLVWASVTVTLPLDSSLLPEFLPDLDIAVWGWGWGAGSLLKMQMGSYRFLL